MYLDFQLFDISDKSLTLKYCKIHLLGDTDFRNKSIKTGGFIVKYSLLYKEQWLDLLTNAKVTQ